MERLGFEDIVRIVKLLDLWKESTLFVHNQLALRKSINFPGFGSFHIKRVKQASAEDVDVYIPFFLPSQTWSKVGGYHVSRTVGTAGVQAAEPLNFAAVASQSGFGRDEIEAALKDIVHALFRVLKKGSTVVLPFSNLGRLYFQNREIKLRFYPDFIETVSDRMNSLKEKSSLDKATESESKELNPPPISPPPANSGTEKTPTRDVPEQDPGPPGADPATTEAKSPCPTDHDFVRGGLVGLNLFNMVTNRKPAFAGVHTHPHSGDRLWSDIKCPICRQMGMPVIEVREQLAKKEKEQDKMLLHLSLEVDRDHMRQIKDVEMSKLRAAISTAQYNHAKAEDKELQRRKEQKNLPMGNLFENRGPPPDRVQQAKELARGLHDQMTIKLTRKLKEKALKEAEDRELNERLAREFKIVEIQSHLQKLQKRQQQQEALTEQIKMQTIRQKEGAVGEPMKENLFARSESLMFLYQKEKAKQLYQEQLAIIKQRQEYEARMAALERQHSLERLALSRKDYFALIIPRLQIGKRPPLDKTNGIFDSAVLGERLGKATNSAED
ncbi:hypothetical protein DFJ73DRAFT_760568 [Zopfochytrium polystomum]|nr:hypothetical protein DFJ73DRAFT_760568 [Zopfochytrium polystomum]